MPLSLDSLIGAARATVAARDRAQAAEAKAKLARTDEARRQAQAEAIAFRDQIEWHATALVLRWEEWTCTCGGSGATPLGLFILEEHARMANSTRLRPPRSDSGAAYPTLPRRIMRDTRPVPFCPECATSHGFIKPHAPRLPAPYLPRPVRGEFVQEWESLTAPLQEDHP